MRHGNTERIPGLDDLYRPLSSVGIKQSLALRPIYRNTGDRVKLVLHSPAPRAVLTAALAVGSKRPEFVQLDSLWVTRDEPEIGEVIWKAFVKYKHDVDRYLKDPKVVECLSVFGKTSAAAVQSWISPLYTSEGLIYIVSGHAIFHGFTAFELSGCTECKLLELEWHEAGVVRLTFEFGRYMGFKHVN